MQVLKDELRHRILLESEHLFLQRGYDRTSMQMIADKVNISKGNLYHYFKNKEELFYELTDSAEEGLKNLILRSRSGLTHRRAAVDHIMRECYRSFLG